MPSKGFVDKYIFVSSLEFGIPLCTCLSIIPMKWFCPFVIQYECRIYFLQPTRFLVILLHEVLTYFLKFSILLYEWPSPTLISDPCQNKYGTIINIL